LPHVGPRAQAAAGAIDFYEAWTGVKQPLPKFDLVAVPGKTGAMENWGLLLFDEFRFLLNHVRLLPTIGETFAVSA